MTAVLSEELIARELQYHPAATQKEAWHRAELALRLRSALLEEAHRLELVPDNNGSPVRETEEENLIRQVLERHVRVNDISDEACQAVFDNRAKMFRSPSLFQAAHILIAADMTSVDARRQARQIAVRIGAILADQPARFSDLAREYSTCPTASEGGCLGQVSVRDVTPEIANMLLAMTPGTICPVPVPSRHGYHVLRLDEREDGRDLPFEMVRELIRDRLREEAWRAAAQHYAATLLGDAQLKEISS
ncbi:peptidylprolyl isomerase [Acidiphilium sp.]|uniref:peptidylprolyl isomerase n=1 Tax=Acidiphilium sp. TaxID=527 RepID=UPI003D060255